MKTQTQFTTAQQEVYAMLTENTGKHLSDSGGAYGRHWERNQSKTIEDFDKEPESIVVFDKRYNYFERTVSVFHYLSQLELDEVCDEFNSLNRDAKDWDGEYYGVSEKAQEYLDTMGFSENYTFNTYNGDSDLTQVLQGTWIRDEDGEVYLLLQIHGGCDVRGGYTNARLFIPAYSTNYSKVGCDSYNEGIIHEYLWDYMDSSTLEDELEHIDVYDENGDIIPTEEAIKLYEEHC